MENCQAREKGKSKVSALVGRLNFSPAYVIDSVTLAKSPGLFPFLLQQNENFSPSIMLVVVCSNVKNTLSVFQKKGTYKIPNNTVISNNKVL